MFLCSGISWVVVVNYEGWQLSCWWTIWGFNVSKNRKDNVDINCCALFTALAVVDNC